MKLSVSFLFFGIISNLLLAQNKLDYVFSEDYLCIDINTENLINFYIEKEDSSYSLIFFHGCDFNKLIILDDISKNKCKKIELKDNKISNIEIIYDIDSLLFLSIKEMNNNHYFLSSKRLSSHSNGYRYYVFRGPQVIASFYSYHNLLYYDIKETDKTKIEFLNILLKIIH